MNKKTTIQQLKLIADRDELKGAKFFYAALKAQGKAVNAYLAEHGLDRTEADLSKLVQSGSMQVAMLRYYVLMSGDTAKWQYRFLRVGNPIKSIGTDITNLFQGWIRNIQLYVHASLGRMITEINDTTLERILRILSDSRTQQLGAYEVAGLIEKETGGEIGRARALIIARTEGTRAASFGHKIAAESWSRETGQRQYKKWIPIVDNRTRRDHLYMDSLKPISAEIKFDVGGYPMDAPGDLTAPAKETVNCRCRCVYMSERMAATLK